jgi:hypothetical protein
MENYMRFSDWEAKKYDAAVKEDAEEIKTAAEPSANAGLIAQLADVEKARKEAVRNKESFQSQILEIEAKLIKIEIERNDLTKKKQDLEHAKTIALTTSKEGKTNVKEDK